MYPRATSGVPANDVRTLGYLGAFGGDNVGALVGATVLARNGLFEAGVNGQAGFALFDYDMFSGAALGGVGVQTRFGLRVDALAELGADGYQHVGQGLFSDDPGGSGVLPYAGLRLGVSYRFLPRASVHPELALWGFAADDLGRETISYTYDVPPRDFPPPGPASATHVVGDARFGALLSLGVAFDGPRR